MATKLGYIIKDREQSAVAEAFRLIRATLQAVNKENQVQAIVFVGTSSGKGSGLVAANTAVTLAYTGKKVILIDADLRKPLFRELFDLREVGLTDIIKEKKKLGDVLQTTEIANLCIVTSGLVPAKPFEILSSPDMHKMIEEAKGLADYVIFNSTSLTVTAGKVIADACILAAKADGIVLVVDAMAVRVKAAKKALAMLEGTKSKMIGVVLNDVKDDQDIFY